MKHITSVLGLQTASQVAIELELNVILKIYCQLCIRFSFLPYQETWFQTLINHAHYKTTGIATN